MFHLCCCCFWFAMIKCKTENNIIYIPDISRSFYNGGWSRRISQSHSAVIRYFFTSPRSEKETNSKFNSSLMLKLIIHHKIYTPLTVWLEDLLTLYISLIHLFYNCEFSLKFWKDLEKYLYRLQYTAKKKKIQRLFLTLIVIPPFQKIYWLLYY